MEACVWEVGGYIHGTQFRQLICRTTQTAIFSTCISQARMHALSRSRDITVT